MYSKEQRPHFINNGFVWSWKCHEKWPLQMYSADPIHLLFVIANNNAFVSYYKSNASILMWFLYHVLRIFFQDITMCPVERKKLPIQFWKFKVKSMYIFRKRSLLKWFGFQKLLRGRVNSSCVQVVLCLELCICCYYCWNVPKSSWAKVIIMAIKSKKEWIYKKWRRKHGCKTITHK